MEDRTLLSSYIAYNAADLAADIAASNVGGGSNQITLGADPGSPYVLTQALPAIASGDNLTVIGNGDTIERSTGPTTPAFRLFQVDKAASLNLQDLTLSHGLAQGWGPAAEGGAVYSSGTLTLGGVTVQSNTAAGSTGAAGTYTGAYGGPGAGAAGGGLYVAAGGATLTDVILISNTARGGDGGPGGPGGAGGWGGAAAGGALFVAGGKAALSDAVILGNAAVGGSGGHLTPEKHTYMYSGVSLQLFVISTSPGAMPPAGATRPAAACMWRAAGSPSPTPPSAATSPREALPTPANTRETPARRSVVACTWRAAAPR